MSNLTEFLIVMNMMRFQRNRISCYL